MVVKDFECRLSKVLSVEDWAKRGEVDDNCPPCLITPLAGHYLGALEAAGEKEMAKDLEKAYASGDMLTIAKELDRIKSRAGSKLRSDLETFDCMSQSFKRSKQDF